MASVDLAQRATRLPGRTRGVLFFAFAFAVMADPVSSVAYAIEAALRALGGHLEPPAPDDGAGDRADRPGHGQLLAAGTRLPAGWRVSGGSRPRVRRAVVVPSHRRPDCRLRAHHRHFDRGRRQRPDRLHPAAGTGAYPACTRPGGRRCRPDVVRSWRALGLRRDDLSVPCGVDRRLVARLGQPTRHPWSCRDHPLGQSRAGRRHPGFPSRHGLGDGHGGSGDVDRAARPARQLGPFALRPGNTRPDDRHRRGAHDGAHRAGRAPARRHPAR